MHLTVYVHYMDGLNGSFSGIHLHQYLRAVLYPQIKMHYLPPEHWSPRFESIFFTAEIISWTFVEALPFEGLDINQMNQSSCLCKEKIPAVYYTIEIRFGQRQIRVMRRFSQFYSLYQQLTSSLSKENKARHLVNGETQINAPTKLCPFGVLTDEMIDSRLDSLNDFLRDILSRPNMSLNPAVIAFLNLDEYNEETNL